MVLRRSKLCAREYRWLEMDRKNIFGRARRGARLKINKKKERVAPRPKGAAPARQKENSSRAWRRA